MDSLQRVGGSLESYRRPSGRRAVLLPFEIDLCEQLGITSDEYWDFVANAHDFVKERSEEYAHIPDVRNDPVSVIVSVVIGIAMTAISALLAPKPQQPKKPPGSLDIEGSQGRSRYTKTANFDGVQSLANLGETIPLIFADRSYECGGIRIDTQLLFSQMITSGTTQTLMALMMIGAGELRKKPDYAGYAIGDLMLRDFSPYKNQLFCSVGGRTDNRLKTGKAKDGGDQYEESEMAIVADGKDAFSLYWSPNTNFREHFSGTRTPSTKTSFGLYNPIPNGFRYLMPYELAMVPDDAKKSSTRDAKRKREKIINYFSRCGGIISSTTKEATYYISPTRLNTNSDEFKPWGTADILQAQDETRITIDEIIQEGQEYMLGSCRAICTRRPRRQWAPEEKGGLTYTFKLLKKLPGSANSVPEAGTKSKLDDLNFAHDDSAITGPWSRGCVQQLSVASLSNSRPCDATEIGIRSEVWRQIQNAANFNAHPEYDVIDRYQENGGAINLGSNTKYTKRYSFFQIFARKSGENDWHDINDGRPFAVRGVSPEYVFNTLFIQHDEDQHEFEIVPLAGSKFYRQVNAGGLLVHLLDGRPLSAADKNNSQTNKVNGYQIFYTGVQEELLLNDVTNPEWVFSFSGQNVGADGNSGPILALGSYNNGRPIPLTNFGKKTIANDYKQGADKSMVKRSAVDGKYLFWWKGTNLTANGPVTRDSINRTELYQGKPTEIQYRIYNNRNRQPYELAGWGEPITMSPDIVTKQDGTLIFNYCVVKIGSQYQYWWGGVRRVTLTSSDLQWHTVTEGAATRRYKKAGAKIPESTTEQPVKGRVDLYADTRSNGKVRSVQTGMTRKNGVTKFYRSGVYLGKANGSNINSIRVNGEIWRSTNAKQAETADSSRRTFPVGTGDSWGLVVDTSKRIVANAMEYGVIFRENSQVYQLWTEGTYKGILVPGSSIDIGNKTYSCVPWDDSRKQSIKLGTVRYLVFPIKIVENIPGQIGTWSITQYQSVTTPAHWGLKRETFQSGSDGAWEIERLQRNVVGEVGFVTTTNELLESGSGATVKLKYYKADTSYDPNAKDAYFWTLEKKGNRYRANTTADIKGTSLKVKITNIREPSSSLGEPVTSDGNGNDDINNRYYDFIEPGTNYSPLNAICDYYINNTDTSSHANKPEHKIVFCNEIIEQFAPGKDSDSSSSPIPQYPNLALAGIKLLNAKEWTSFNSLSTYVKHGHMVERLFDRSDTSSSVNGKGATNLFPEIAHHLLTSHEYGAGELIGAASVDTKAMEKAARFCKAEGFYWDGIVTESQNLRQFIFENAAFMLLDFTIKGGKFALVPSVPFNDGGDYRMKRSAKPVIKALFSDGNISGLEVSFLTPEERQPFIGVCMFRQEKVNAFPEMRTMTMRLSNAQGGSDIDPVERFDCSAFMTSENHARMFLRYALKVRQLVDHGIKFETTPQSAMNLEPGEYFRVATTVTHTERFTSGSIDDQGNITTTTPIGNGAVINVVYWRPGETVVLRDKTTVLDNKATNAALFGSLFCQVTSVAEARVYKCESLSYAENGLVEISGSVSPLNDKGQLLLLEWEEGDIDFIEETF